jgi:hypothetical protein
VIYIQDGTTVTQYQGDPRQIELRANRSITIQVGTPVQQIPTFDMSGLT